MRLNQLLQVCVFMLLLMPVAGLSVTGLLESGADAASERMHDMLNRVDPDRRLERGGQALVGLLGLSPRDFELSQKNLDRGLRRAENGYRLLRRVTGNAFMKNLARRPGAALERLGDGIAAELSKASWANVQRAFEDPLRLPPELERLLQRS